MQRWWKEYKGGCGASTAEDAKMEVVRRAGAGDERARKALQVLIDPVLGRKAEKLLKDTGGGELEKVIDLLAKVQGVRELLSANKPLKRAIDHAIYLHLSRGREKVLANIIARVEAMGERVHVAGKNPPVTERYDVEEVVHPPRQRSVSESAAELLRIARTMRDKYGVRAVEDPRVPAGELPARTHDIDGMIKVLGGGASPGYVAFAHDVLLHTARKRGLDAVADELRGITVHGRIARVRKLKLTKKNERFVLAKKASADCTSPGGTAFDSFTIPALLSNSIGNLEIHADVVEQDPRPGKRGTYRISRNAHVGNVSFMVGRTEDGRDVLYVHHIELRHPQRLVANAEELAGRFVSWLAGYARANRFDVLAFDPVQVSNHVPLAEMVYRELSRLGAGELKAHGVLPLDHVTGEKTTTLEHYGSPWVIARKRGKHPLALEL